MNALLILIGVILLLVLAFFLRRRNRNQGEERALTALVFLLTEPRKLADWQVRQAAAHALGVELQIGTAPEPNTIFPVAAEKIQTSLPAGAGMTYFINTGERQYLINSFNQPYMEDPETFAEEIPDLRLRRAVASHRAWISADLFGANPSAGERAEIYAVLGRLLAPFAADDCRAIYCPELGRCNEIAPQVQEQLNGGKPLEIFAEPTNAPIVDIPDDDPRLLAAVAEAQRRWPEFVAAFGQRSNPEQPFLIKARFAAGEHAEYMWVSVQQISAQNQILGRLENSPGNLPTLKEGDAVTVEWADLNDWLCVIEDQPVGGFTMKVMSELLHPGKPGTSES